MICPKQYENMLFELGAPIEGADDRALQGGHALCAVRMLREACMPVLVGDVYRRRSGGIEMSCEKCFADPRPCEARRSYIHRTFEVTEQNINAYLHSRDGEELFVITEGDPAAIADRAITNA